MTTGNNVNCQICEGLQDILDTSDEKHVQIRHKLTAVINSEDQTSNWLRLICLCCKEKIDDLWEFKMLCQKAYSKFLTEENSCNITTKSASNEPCIESDQEMIEWLDEIDEECNEAKENHQEYEMIEILNQESKEINDARDASEDLENPDGMPKGLKKEAMFPAKEKLPQNLRISELHPTSFVCDVCEKSFPMKAQLTKHMNLNHLKKKPLNLLNTSDKKKFQCHICGIKTIGKVELRVHMQSHTDERIHCIICNQSYNTDSTFYGHFKKYHTGSQKMYKCSFCSIEFHSGQKRKFHERIHTGEKPYKCTMCSKAFRTRTSLKRHINTHTREKTYPCEFCKKEFTNSGNLSVHKRIHTGEKPYECSNCSERFRELKMWKNHCKMCSETSQNVKRTKNEQE